MNKRDFWNALDDKGKEEFPEWFKELKEMFQAEFTGDMPPGTLADPFPKPVRCEK